MHFQYWNELSFNFYIKFGIYKFFYKFITHSISLCFFQHINKLRYIFFQGIIKSINLPIFDDIIPIRFNSILYQKLIPNSIPFLFFFSN